MHWWSSRIVLPAAVWSAVYEYRISYSYNTAVPICWLLYDYGTGRGLLIKVTLYTKHSGLENREYGRGDPFRWPRDILYPHKLALTSPTCGGRSVGIVRLRTKATEFVLFCLYTKQRNV
jgi:hypothetical protein